MPTCITYDYKYWRSMRLNATQYILDINVIVIVIVLLFVDVVIASYL